MITDRDREIIDHIYQFEFATINQIAKIFCRDQKFGYDIARRRLKKIITQGDYMKSIRNSETNELIFVPIDSKIKKISKHDVLLMNYYTELIGLGVEIEVFEKEKQFKNMFVDAFCVLKFGGYRLYQLVEIQLRHDFVDMTRFKDAVPSIVSNTSNYYPKIVIVQDTKHDYSNENETEMEVVMLKTDLKDIAKVLL